MTAEFDRAPRRSGLPERSGGWRGLGRPSRVAPRRRRLRALSAQRLRFADTRVIHSFHRDVGSAFWTPSNSLKSRLRLSPSLRGSLSLRTCAPTAPASSRSYGRRSRGALTCRPGVRGGCRAASSDRRPRLALTPIAVGIWLEGEEPSDPTGALGRKKRHRRASPSVRNRSARGHRSTPNEGSNPVSRDVAAECLRQADGPPTQGERRAPTRLTSSVRAAGFPLVKRPL